MQSNDVFYSNIKSTIRKYIEGGFHKGKPNRETQMILDSFHLTDGDILYKVSCTDNPSSKLLKLCIPKIMIKNVLHELHNDVKSGHPGINAMFRNAKELYYFPQMYSIISEYVKNCSICQRLKINHNIWDLIYVF